MSKKRLAMLGGLALALASVASAALSARGTSGNWSAGARAEWPRSEPDAREAGPALPDFAFHDQRGRLVDKRDLLGHVWIADFIYTSCQSACPLLTSRLVTVQRRLLDPRLQFVSFSVDPDTDSPEVMAQYAKLWNANESRWRLLSTDALGLNRLTASMKVEISRTQGDVVHSDRFFLVDARGVVVRSFDSSDDAALDRLLADAGNLLGSAPAAAVNGRSGGELFSSLGCAGCHGNPQLAPPLAGLLGAHVMLERGDSVEANDDYVRESILAPAAKCVAGYPNSMPAYGSILTNTQVDALVGYVRSLRGTPVAEEAARQTDPVCGMPVRVTKDTPSAEYSGRSYHFCSRTCAQHFQTDPEKYLHAR